MRINSAQVLQFAHLVLLTIDRLSESLTLFEVLNVARAALFHSALLLQAREFIAAKESLIPLAYVLQ